MRRADVQQGKSDAISADRPLMNPDSDELDYAATASHLAERILKAAAPEGFVIGLTGPWGSGKTSLLNMILFYLRERDEDERPLIIQFNPWWFSDREDLARRFFDTLKTGFSSQESKTERIRDLLGSLGNAVARVPIEKVSVLGQAVTWLASRTALTVPELKEMISEQLLDLGKTIVVTIDDIDRLSFDEIRQVFRLVKAVGDFPNVIYMLAFDRGIVAKALAEPDSGDGESFIQKIVQVPIDLPDVDRSALNRMFFSKLDALAGDPDPDLFDPQHWGNVFFDGIQPFLQTPRDVTRLMNALQFTYPAVKHEVNLVDFVAIEALRVFCPSVYGLVRSSSESLLRRFIGVSSTHKQPTTDDLLRPANVREPYQKVVQAMLERLFPKLSGNYSSGFESTWRRQGRICSAEKFAIYFKLALPREEVSKLEIKALLDAAADSNDFGARLLALSQEILPDGSSRVRVMLERLEDYTAKVITLEQVPNIVEALLDVGDRISRDEDKGRGMFDFGNDFRIARILYQLLRRVDEPQRYQILRESAGRGSAIGTIVREVLMFGAPPKNPGDQTMITPEHHQELQAIVLGRIRRAATEGSLLAVPRLSRVLHGWQQLASESEVGHWASEAIKDDNNLVTILVGFLQSGSTHTMGDRTEKTYYRLDPLWVDRFIDSSAIIQRCRDILAKDDGLLPRPKLALKQFIQEYEIRAAGNDPDDPLLKA